MEQYNFQLWSSFSQWHLPLPQWWPAKFWSIFHPPFISFFPTKAHFEFRIDYPKAVIDTFAFLSMSFALQKVHCNAPKDVPDQQILPVKTLNVFQLWSLCFTSLFSLIFSFRIFRSARTSCTTFDVSRPVLKIWITYIQAYMPHESSGDSSNQPDGPMGSPRRLP